MAAPGSAVLNREGWREWVIPRSEPLEQEEPMSPKHTLKMPASGPFLSAKVHEALERRGTYDGFELPPDTMRAMEKVYVTHPEDQADYREWNYDERTHWLLTCDANCKLAADFAKKKLIEEQERPFKMSASSSSMESSGRSEPPYGNMDADLPEEERQDHVFAMEVMLGHDDFFHNELDKKYRGAYLYILRNGKLPEPESSKRKRPPTSNNEVETAQEPPVNRLRSDMPVKRSSFAMQLMELHRGERRREKGRAMQEMRRQRQLEQPTRATSSESMAMRRSLPNKEPSPRPVPTGRELRRRKFNTLRTAAMAAAEEARAAEKRATKVEDFEASLRQAFLGSSVCSLIRKECGVAKRDRGLTAKDEAISYLYGAHIADLEEESLDDLVEMA